MDNAHFGHVLQQLLDTNGRTPDWLAAQLGCPQTTVDDWLHGRSQPDTQTVTAIIHLFSVPPAIAQSIQQQITNQTNFYGPIINSIINTGPTIIINNNYSLFSEQSIKAGIKRLLAWEDAPAHMQHSLSGQLIWQLNRVSSQGVLKSVCFVLIWLGLAWLATPFLQWPLTDLGQRATAVAGYILASLLTPTAVASAILLADKPSQPTPNRPDVVAYTLLTFAGAFISYQITAVVFGALAITLYYFTAASLSTFWWALLWLLPLIFTYNIAYQIPEQRLETFKGEWKYDPFDPYILLVSVLMALLFPVFVYFSYNWLAQPIMGVLVLILIMGMALWEQRHGSNQTRTILLVGFLLPLALFTLNFIFTDYWQVALLQNPAYVLLVLAYALSLILLWVTLAVRQKLAISPVGALAWPLTTAVSYLLLYTLPHQVRWLALAPLALFLLVCLLSSRFPNRHLLVHPSLLLAFFNVGLSLYIASQTAVPIGLNLLGFVLLTAVLFRWAAHQPAAATLS